MSNGQIQSILLKYYEYFNIATLSNDIFRWIGWGIIYILRGICNGVETSVDTVLQLGGLLTADSITSFYNQYKVLIWVVLTASIVFVGFLIMFNKVKDRLAVLQNLLIAIIVIVGMPTFLLQFNSLIQTGYQAFTSTSSSMADDIIRSNVTDLLLLDNNGFTSVPNPSNNIPDFGVVDINNEIDPDDYPNLQHKEVFTKKININPMSDYEVIDMKDGWIDFFDEHYYRFDVNFGTTMITLAVTSFVFIFSGIKIARLLFELVFHEFFATIMAFADLHSGQRFKAVIQSMLSTGFTIIFMALLLKLYTLACTWTGQHITTGLAYVLCLVGLSFAVIDGPNLVERVLGVDAGLNSPFRTFLVAKSAVRGITNTVRNGKRALDNHRAKANANSSSNNNSSAVNNSSNHSSSSTSDNSSRVNGTSNNTDNNINNNNSTNHGTSNNNTDSRVNTSEVTSASSNGGANETTNVSQSPINNTPTGNSSPQDVPNNTPANLDSRVNAPQTPTNQSQSPINDKSSTSQGRNSSPINADDSKVQQATSKPDVKPPQTKVNSNTSETKAPKPQTTSSTSARPQTAQQTNTVNHHNNQTTYNLRRNNNYNSTRPYNSNNKEVNNNVPNSKGNKKV